MVGVPAPGTSSNNKCDVVFGQGSQPGTGAQFAQPFELDYHFPTRSLFIATVGGPLAEGCPSACSANQVANLIWRVR